MILESWHYVDHIAEPSGCNVGQIEFTKSVNRTQLGAMENDVSLTAYNSRNAATPDFTTTQTAQACKNRLRYSQSGLPTSQPAENERSKVRCKGLAPYKVLTLSGAFFTAQQSAGGCSNVDDRLIGIAGSDRGALR